MVPKIECPSSSSISISTMSPKRRNDVRGSPNSMVSIMRRSARQDEPTLAKSRLDTVPDPTIVPASMRRVFTACEMSVGKSKFISTPALGRPSSMPFTRLISGRGIVPPFQASPSSSGAAAPGENAGGGFDWKKAKADIVDQHEQADVLGRAIGGDTHRHIARDDCDFGLQIDAPSLVGDRDRIARPQQHV